MKAISLWQPIDTAPRDRTEVDLWVDTDSGGERVADAFYEAGEWKCYDQIWFDRSVEEPKLTFNDGTMRWRTATHWMPLPAPPAD